MSKASRCLCTRSQHVIAITHVVTCRRSYKILKLSHENLVTFTTLSPSHNIFVCAQEQLAHETNQT